MAPRPQEQPPAAACIVALALLSDGHCCKRGLDVLDPLDAYGQRGLTQGELRAVEHGFCEDLLTTANGHRGAAFLRDARSLRQLLSEIEEPLLSASDSRSFRSV